MLTPEQLYAASSHLMARSRQLTMQANALHADPQGARELRESSREAKTLSDACLQLAQTSPALPTRPYLAGNDARDIPEERNGDGIAL